MQEISKGKLPYLYGGKPPGCKNCKSTEFVSKFCQFGMTGHGQCDKGQIFYLVQQLLDREFYEILQFTPCDLWPLLKGRTLYFSGDSQTQVRRSLFEKRAMRADILPDAATSGQEAHFSLDMKFTHSSANILA